MYYALYKWNKKSGKLLAGVILSLTPDEVCAMFDCGGPPVGSYEAEQKHVERLQQDVPKEKFNFNRFSWTVEAERDFAGEQFEGLYPPPGIKFPHLPLLDS